MKDQLRREFVATISHDLRTPLMSIQGYLETLAVKADSLTESERRRYIQIALTQSEKVGGLAQQLFELARLEHGAVTPLYEKFILPDLVQDVLQKFELLLLQSDLDTDVNIQKSLPIINADMSMIERVLTNLVDNAIRHTPKGGRITLCIWSDEINVYFEIEDTGCGISSEIRKTLFETPSTIDFRRFDNGGLGLIIVRRMLQLHDGDITLIDSSGACFRFYIPIDIY
ncbi:sensor histidine kinase [Erwinia sp. MYb416]|uniref:sensor histidine kinase n=1 Tax=Erwinia sp. MYb416 TaxID=3108532 RepID=UPI0030ABC361